jgi:hypothetical protein
MTTPTIPELIDGVLAKRRERLPMISSSRIKIESLDNALGELNDTLEALSQQPRAQQELRAAIADAGLDKCRTAIRAVLEECLRVESRFGRETINFGVSGQARVGKSTLLQALSGLDNRAIPTGTGTPVTAVRSKILNKPHQLACLHMHSWESFRDEVLAPYHKDLNLGKPPATVAEFRTQYYPAPAADDENSRNVMLDRLLRMRDSLDSYARHLTGGEQVISDFSELPLWVAYPADGEPGRMDNRYLAVRQAVIECPFPHAIARSIGLIDLPGLGEIAASAEAHHVKGLRDDVDFVFLVKRANDGMAFWKNEDGQARKLIDMARHPIRDTADFLGIVSNEGNVHPETLYKMLANINRLANVGLEHYPIPLFRCEGNNPESVGIHLLGPALTRLADRLPKMDAELLSHVQKNMDDVVDHVGKHIQALEAALARSLPEAPGTHERLSMLTGKLLNRVAQDLDQVQKRYYDVARSNTENTEFIASIQSAHQELVAWANNGLGIGEREWMEQALGCFARDKTTAKFATDELNRVRVHIGEVYCRLDAHLHAETDALFEEIGTLFAERCGRLLQNRRGVQALRALADQLGDGDETSPNLENALRELLSLKVSYRSHFHPVVRAELDILAQTYDDPDTREKMPTVPLQDTTQSGASAVLRDLTNLAVKASARVRNELLRDVGLMPKILHAAAEQFDDSFVRSGTSETEFARFARSWRDELFPDEFADVDTTRIDVKAVRQSFGKARAVIDTLLDHTPHE